MTAFRDEVVEFVCSCSWIFDFVDLHLCFNGKDLRKTARADWRLFVLASFSLFRMTFVEMVRRGLDLAEDYYNTIDSQWKWIGERDVPGGLDTNFPSRMKGVVFVRVE